MTIPDFQSLMLPMLEAISDGRVYTNREVIFRLAQRFALSERELSERLRSGQQVFANRFAWAKAHLKKAGLVESPARGAICITPDGRNVLLSRPEKITLHFLKTFDAYTWNKKPALLPRLADEPIDDDEEMLDTPEELLLASYLSLREALSDELLEQVKSCSPQFFERLVVELLVSMGYGGSIADAGQAIGRTRDGGIDGMIKEDKLGLDVVCIQAKRWESNVGRPVVQAFAGSMEAVRARKGVLMTTASFTGDAHEYVTQIGRKIVLVDGQQLAELMIDHNVGVTDAKRYMVKKIDLDYFVEDDVSGGGR